MNKKIIVIDYGVGNVGSILNMLKRIGADVVASNSKNEIENADKLILPGVGSFDYGMEMLEKSGLKELVINHALIEKKPILGICLGMQMLGKKSEEGIKEGLNLIPFETKKFKFDNNKLKIPHMGWDISNISIERDPIFKDIIEEQRYYFVHSYHAVCDEEKYELMSCEYGYKFSSAVKKDNIYGVQFHPEKSHKFGMKLLENFVREVN